METRDTCLFDEVSRLYGADIKAEVDEIIWLMYHESQLNRMLVKDMEYLYEESVIVKRRFYFPYGIKWKRMESIVHEMKKYEPEDKNSYNHALILIQTSKEHPLIMSELQWLNEITDGFSPKAEIRWGLGINEELDERAFIMMVYSK